MAENDYDSVMKMFEEDLGKLNLVLNGKQKEQFMEYYKLLA